MDKFAFYAWYETEHNALHQAWSADVGTPFYEKSKWLQRERSLNDLARSYANSLGIQPPYLVPPGQRDK